MNTSGVVGGSGLEDWKWEYEKIFQKGYLRAAPPVMLCVYPNVHLCALLTDNNIHCVSPRVNHGSQQGKVRVQCNTR